MPKKSVASRVSRKSAEEIPRATKADLDRLRAAMKADIDTSDILERKRFHRLKRGENCKLPPRPSMTRAAVAKQMKRLNLSVAALWKRAHRYYPELTQPAVDEFLQGKRQLELSSVEALLAAVGLHLAPNVQPRQRP